VAFFLEVLHVGLHHNQETRIEEIRVLLEHTPLLPGGTVEKLGDQIYVLLLTGRIHHRLRCKKRIGCGCRQKSGRS
jgi:hypothetical protein